MEKNKQNTIFCCCHFLQKPHPQKQKKHTATSPWNRKKKTPNSPASLLQQLRPGVEVHGR